MRYFLPFLALAFTACGGGNVGEASKAEGRDKKAHENIVNIVDTMILRRGDFRSELISNGRLRAVQKSDLKFSGSGVVERLNVENGQFVAAGSVIAELDSENAQLGLTQAQQTMTKAQLDLQDKLLGFGYLAKDTAKVPEETMRIARIRSGYDDAVVGLKKAKVELNGRIIRAPFSGKIANLKTKQHENPKGDFFCSVINDGSFDVEFTVLEGEVHNVREGGAVSISTFNDPLQRQKGVVRSINPTVDEKGQVVITASIPNSGRGLLDGMNVKVYVENSLRERLVVPKSAVLIRDNREVLFTFGKDGKAHWTYVIVEASNSREHAVRANEDRGAELEAGASIITSGNLNLADNSGVEIKAK
ncbi:MAG: efflux RND transporter periplasmic adaptor subunit [Mucinivorans sp.]